MALEIEKRFLVTGDDWKEHAISSMQIRQGYLSINFEEWVVRVRIIDNKQSFIGLKSSLNGTINTEFEYKIPIEDAESIWNNLNHKLKKIRFNLNFNNASWVIDCFQDKNYPLKIAEVELENSQSIVSTPNWCGEEITGQKHLSNAALARLPISNWSLKELKIFNLD